MKTKLAIPFIILFIIGAKSINAQSCERSNEIGDEILLIYKKKIKTGIDVVDHYGKKLADGIKKRWNKDINGSQKIGPRALYFGTPEKGTVTSATQRSFISDITRTNKVKIALEKIKGKAETEVCISIFNTETRTKEQRKYYIFEEGDYTKTKMFTLNNVLDCIITVNIKGNSNTKSFKYNLTAKEIKEDSSADSNGELAVKPLKKKSETKVKVKKKTNK